MTLLEVGKLEEIQRIKAKYDQIVMLQCDHLDLRAAHYELGRDVKEQVHQILKRRLDCLKIKDAREKFMMVRECWDALQNKAHSSKVSTKLRNAISAYMDCLRVWGEAAQLDNVEHKILQGIPGRRMSDDLAMLLQDDNIGCQTGVYRQSDGSVIVWHTEEDVEGEVGARFDQLRLFSFQCGGEDAHRTITAFIYPDLLPGPAFGWHNTFVQTVDSLYLRPSVGHNHIFANIASWITLCFGHEIEIDEIIKELGPFVDGYVITSIKVRNHNIQVKKVEFADDSQLVSILKAIPGDYLFQVNVVSKKGNKLARRYEQISYEDRISFEDRITRTKRWIRELNSDDLSLESVIRMLVSHEGDDFAYSNASVKAYFIGKVSLEVLEAWVGCGPPFMDDYLLKFVIPHSS